MGNWLKEFCKKEFNGGDKEARTPDPLLAKQMLYQLSYIPVECFNDKKLNYYVRI
jgi:hypothetical protein